MGNAYTCIVSAWENSPCSCARICYTPLSKVLHVIIVEVTKAKAQPSTEVLSSLSQAFVKHLASMRNTDFAFMCSIGLYIIGYLDRKFMLLVAVTARQAM